MKRLKYSMPSIHVFKSQISYPQGTLPTDLEVWDGEQNKTFMISWKQLKTCYSTWAVRSPWG